MKTLKNPKLKTGLHIYSIHIHTHFVFILKDSGLPFLFVKNIDKEVTM